MRTRNRLLDIGIVALLAWIVTNACAGIERTNMPQSTPPNAIATSEIVATTIPTSMPILADSAKDSNSPAPSPSPQALNPDQDTSSFAEVINVSTSGSDGSYTFSVTIESPDTGCDQYDDWWEVLSEDGELLYRRILLHSHANEQPFTRSGGKVDVSASDVVIIRAHMNADGYGGVAMVGSVDAGFSQKTLATDFASDVEFQTPLPDGCAF